MAEPLDPVEAAQLFRSGAQLAYVSTPGAWFVAGQWLGQLSLVSPIPFEDPVAYFTSNPVILYDPDTPPTPPQAVSAVITAGAPRSAFIGGNRGY